MSDDMNIPSSARMIRDHDFIALHETAKHWPPPRAAAFIQGLPVHQQVIFFRVLPRELAADVFAYLPVEAQDSLLKAMGHEEVARILNEMAPDDRTALLDELPAAATKQLLALLTPEERAVALSLLGYPEGSIGRLMTPDYVRSRPDWTIEHVLDHIRRYGSDSETLSIVYVIDERERLIGEIGIRRILLSPLTARVNEVMDPHVVALKASDPQESAVPVFQREGRVALPVTDSEGVLIGIVTVDDVLDVAQAEATNTLQRFGGVEALNEPYLELSFLRMVRKRAGWLVVLFLGEMLTRRRWGSSRGKSSARWCLRCSCPSSSPAVAILVRRPPPW
jgi:magnesium transporter